MVQQTSTRTIIIKNDVQGLPGLKKVADNLAQITRNTRNTSKSLSNLSAGFGRFGNIIRGVLAGLSFREFARAADDMQLLRDRLVVFTGSAEEADKTFRGIANAASITRTSISDLGQVYNRVALSTSELGLSSEGLLDVVTVLQNSFKLSGSTAAEATGAAIQLTQGLSSGALRGQELRSVLEANAVLSEKLADGFGIARGQLIKLAESGAITSTKVLNILANNMEEINSKAAKIQTTIGQGLILVFDAFKLKIDELNRELDITGKFNKGLEVVKENLDGILKTIGILVSTGLLIKLASQINILRKAIALEGIVSLATKLNPTILALTAAAGAAALFWEKLNPPKGVKAELERLDANISDLTETFKELEYKVKNTWVSLSDTSRLERVKKELDELKKKREELAKRLPKPKTEGGLKDDLKSISDVQNVLLTSTKKYEKALSELNTQQDMGKVSLEEYQKRLDALQIDKLNSEYREGKITLDDYNKSLQEIEFRSNALARGASSYARQVGTLSDQIAGGITQTFNRLEDSLVEFTKNGKFEFRKFTQAVLEDLNRIIIRSLILAPLANAITNAITAGATAGAGEATSTGSAQGQFATPSVPASAKGNVFEGGIKKFASGGIVSQPTLFKFGGGRTGLMGEAGNEAILPLRRTPTGDLGVTSVGQSKQDVTVNVINQNSDNQVETRETEVNGVKVLDVLITRKIKDTFASGQLDKTMSSLYGVGRRGN